MSMYESAERINKDLMNLFNSIPIKQFSLMQREEILNIIIRFGAVAKFRCRSNIAYKNFVDSCFKDIAFTDLKQVDSEKDFKILVAELIPKDYL